MLDCIGLTVAKFMLYFLLHPWQYIWHKISEFLTARLVTHLKRDSASAPKLLCAACVVRAYMNYIAEVTLKLHDVMVFIGILIAYHALSIYQSSFGTTSWLISRLPSSFGWWLGD
ncbi:hypothetical protein VNO78_00155 [Psophocarpus tetragonolobus]|uniref:Uncharacterized protein n=1 Tax=Psophocarpus tetragonolobus TaxID=3891 RepID=A0AAN9XTX1_PSOTE